MGEKVGFVTMGEVKGERGEIPKIGVGMLGYAFMGKAHTNAYKKYPYIFWPPAAIPRLVAICGRNEKAVEEARIRYGYEKAYRDWQEMLNDPKVQIFDNSGPNSLHCEPSVAALNMGKHVFCEKPLAGTVEEARAMWEAAQKSSAKSMVCFNYRFLPALRLARDFIAEGKLGEIYHFRAQYLQEWIMDPNFPMVWRLDKDVAGSGALGDLGSHIIDLARFLVGDIATVSALTRTFIKERPSLEDPTRKVPVTVDDAFVAVVEFSCGAIGTLEASRFCAGRKNHQVIEINGSRGSIRFNLERLNELEVHLVGEEPKVFQGFHQVMVTESYHPFYEHWWPHGHIIGWEHTFIHAISHFLDAVVNNKEIAPYGATFEDGYRCAVICDTIVRSSLSGKKEELRY
ncbi:MAG: Gfo/Idh/MocA family oxidoreductase [Candidatus Atribacteria bacterium]|nr:Gfo/Idh/MocA family oxidoreductase [Candidatus Atribacteria bacterium]